MEESPTTPIATLPGALTTTTPRTWSRTFPATVQQVRRARRFLAAVLDGSPEAPDALVCLSELASNAVLHSRSRQPGGRFTVRIALDPARLHVEVEDEGGAWEHRAQQDGQRGRGLAIVAGLASQWGISGDGTSARAVWFEFGRR